MGPFSIITVSLNSESVLPDCLQSVAGQCRPVRHLVQDGGSCDATVTLAREAGAEVASASDDGIYDAMNHGIARVDNGIIGLLNADDFYASDRVTQLVESAMTDGVDACFGDLVYVRETQESSELKVDMRDTRSAAPNFRVVRYWKAWRGTGGPIDTEQIAQAMLWGWMPPHPTFFVRKEVYDRLGTFRLNHGTAADYELMLRCLSKHRIQAYYIPDVLVCMRVGGASNESIGKRTAANAMDRRAWETNALKPLPWTRIMKPLRKLPQWLPVGPQAWRPGASVEQWWDDDAPRKALPEKQ